MHRADKGFILAEHRAVQLVIHNPEAQGSGGVRFVEIAELAFQHGEREVRGEEAQHAEEVARDVVRVECIHVPLKGEGGGHATVVPATPTTLVALPCTMPGKVFGLPRPPAAESRGAPHGAPGGQGEVRCAQVGAVRGTWRDSERSTTRGARPAEAVVFILNGAMVLHIVKPDEGGQAAVGDVLHRVLALEMDGDSGGDHGQRRNVLWAKRWRERLDVCAHCRTRALQRQRRGVGTEEGAGRGLGAGQKEVDAMQQGRHKAVLATWRTDEAMEGRIIHQGLVRRAGTPGCRTWHRRAYWGAMRVRGEAHRHRRGPGGKGVARIFALFMDGGVEFAFVV